MTHEPSPASGIFKKRTSGLPGLLTFLLQLLVVVTQNNGSVSKVFLASVDDAALFLNFFENPSSHTPRTRQNLLYCGAAACYPTS
jgi:hypothetical protein